ncbi:MAG TPA: sulfite exporter TauE/SafE family protein [Anaerolineae bacterium]|nr:sulfite exporter TauE/SafE family protein [Anaerolineae bacterium]
MEDLMGQNVSILIFMAVGFFAQIIDGALGMAYGVSSNSVLLALGVPPKIASACVHMAEVVTTAISGFSHFKVGNVDKNLALRLIVPGVLGGVLGAYLLTQLDGDKIKPYICIYLLIMGLVILYRAFRAWREREINKNLIPPLAIVGGFMDAIGGGGWGPVVTTTLVASGKQPRFAIGSVNMSEFFVTFSESITFFFTIGALFTGYWRIILGLLLGGAIAAPLAAYVCKFIPRKTLMILVGLVIIFLQVRTLLSIWWGIKIF